MRKIGFGMLLAFASAVAFGAAQEAETKAPEKKADAKAEAKAPEKKADAKAEAKAPEKKADAKADAKAPEKKPEVKKAPKVPALPWFVPARAQELEDTKTYKVPAEGIRVKVELKAGEQRSFILKENAPGRWQVCALDTDVATVKAVARDEGGCFTDPADTFEITAVGPGRTLLEMSLRNDRNAPLRAFRCYIEVK